MNENRPKIITSAENNPAEKIAEVIKKGFKLFEKENFLIVSRGSGDSYFKILRDSLFDYVEGVVLLERFFKKDKCTQKGEKYKTLSEKDKKTIRDFEELATNIPSASELNNEEIKKYTDKINEYNEKMFEIKPELRVYDTFKYQDINLVEFDLIPDEEKEIMCSMYADYALTFLSFITWSPVTESSYMITTIEYSDYVDLILMPIKKEED